MKEMKRICIGLGKMGSSIIMEVGDVEEMGKKSVEVVEMRGVGMWIPQRE